MSRVDDALRRASSDMTSVHAPVAVDPPVVAFDEAALEMYVGERRAPARRKPEARPTQPARSPSPPVRPAALHASLEGKAVSSRQTSPVSIEQYRRLATALHAIQAERGNNWAASAGGIYVAAKHFAIEAWVTQPAHGHPASFTVKLDLIGNY